LCDRLQSTAFWDFLARTKKYKLGAKPNLRLPGTISTIRGKILLLAMSHGLNAIALAFTTHYEFRVGQN